MKFHLSGARPLSVQLAVAARRSVLFSLVVLAACGGGSSSNDSADATASADARQKALASGAQTIGPATDVAGEGTGESIYTEGAKLVRATPPCRWASAGA